MAALAPPRLEPAAAAIPRPHTPRGLPPAAATTFLRHAVALTLASSRPAPSPRHPPPPPPPRRFHSRRRCRRRLPSRRHRCRHPRFHRPRRAPRHRQDRRPCTTAAAPSGTSHNPSNSRSCLYRRLSTPDVRPYCRRRYPCHWDRKVSRIFGQVARRSPPEARGGLQNGRLWRPCCQPRSSGWWRGDLEVSRVCLGRLSWPLGGMGGRESAARACSAR